MHEGEDFFDVVTCQGDILACGGDDSRNDIGQLILADSQQSGVRGLGGRSTSMGVLQTARPADDRALVVPIPPVPYRI